MINNIKVKTKTLLRAILFVFVGLSTFVSCEDQLEEAPESLISLESINENTMESLILGMYESITRERNRSFESRYLRLLELQAEYQWGRGGTRTRLSNYDFNGASLSDKQTMWSSFYKSIGRANVLISLINTTEDLSESSKNLGGGEARFFRAVMHYQLVRIWGQVPLRLEPVKDASQADLALSSIDNIYASIIADLQFAEDNLPATADPGRATAGSAKTFLADVYLTRKEYQLAKDKAKEIIDNAATYGYELVSDFSSLFSPTAPTNSEDVFSIKFAQIIGFGNFHTDAWAMREPRVNGVRLGVAAGFSTASAFESGNANPASTFITGWDDADIRKQYTLVDKVTLPDGTEVDVIPQVTRDIDLDGDGTVETERGLYTFGKYRDPGSPGEFGSGNDFYLMRYADVFLIYAEAENQLNGPTQSAIDAINVVRDRAYNGSAPDLLPEEIASKEAFDDRIFTERGYEFVQESKRWFDIVRTNRFSIISDALKPLGPNGDIATNPYWPLPALETSVNGGL